jgi:hypothetical protein
MARLTAQIAERGGKAAHTIVTANGPIGLSALQAILPICGFLLPDTYLDDYNLACVDIATDIP